MAGQAREQRRARCKSGSKISCAPRVGPAPDLSAAERKKLFDEFVGWTRKSLGDAGQSVRQ
jgi:hypothetical protein